jgi:CheY-like chemotaxis protein
MASKIANMQQAEQSSNDAPRLLLCDDSPIERLALGHYLRSNGYAVDEAGDGQSALQFLKNRQIDLLLLDLQMPEVDGFHVLNYVAEHRRSLPVILLSGMKPDEIQDKILGLKDQELPPLLLKPVDPEQLVEMVELRLSGELP